MSSSKEYLIAKKNLLRLNAQAKVDALSNAIDALKDAKCVCCTDGLHKNDIDLEGLILQMTDVMSVAKGETSRLNVVEPQAIDDHYMGVSDDE
jgi:adenine deaminase|tara:strand:+ start:6442 stop:6720 length:279 start_codon:yes stop_codon:yes gene_type:complete